MSEREDGELLVAWRDGDERAAAELVERHFEAIHRFFQGKLEHQAEDLVQQTFLACVRNLEAFRGGATFRTYLYQIARSKLYDALRRRRDTDVSMCTMAALRTSPSGWVARKGELQLVQVALEELPLELQLAVELFYFEELSAREVAGALEIPEGTVRSRLRKALELLKASVKRLATTDAQAQKVLDGLAQRVGTKQPAAAAPPEPAPAPEPAPEALAGQAPARVGRYALSHRIAVGGMGAVFRGQDVDSGQAVAVKLMHEHLGQRAYRWRFQREARLAAALRHPNVVRVREHGRLEATGQLYLAMDLVQGPTVRHLFDCEIPRDVWCALLCQLLEALAYVHARDVLHRDIKPSNVLVERHATGELVLRLVDFGLAKDLAGDASQKTAADQVLGTPVYMAPEQASGDELLGPAADLYPVGVLLFQLLAGRPPFEGSAASVLMQKLRGPAPLELLPEDTHCELRALVGELLERDPHRRPQSAAAVRARLLPLAGSARLSEASWATLERTLPSRQRAGPPTAGAARGALELWGRQSERQRLASVAKRVEEGEPRLVLVEGELGLGKSELVHRLALQLREEGRFEVVQAAHSERGILSSMRAAVERTLRTTGRSRGALEKAVRALLRRTGCEEESMATSLLQLLRPEELGGGASRRERNFATLTRFFRHLAAERPLLLVIDGAPDSDEDAAGLMRHLLFDLWSERYRLLCVVTQRPEPKRREPRVARVLREMEASHPDALVRLTLEPLADDVLLSGLAREYDLGESRQHDIVAAAAGNPAFARMLAGVAELPKVPTLGGGDERRHDTGDSALPRQLRATLDVLLEERLERVSDGEALRELLQHLAVLGGEADVALLAALGGPEGTAAGTEASGSEAIADAIDTLVELQLVTEPAIDQLRLAYPAMREVLLENVAPRKLRRLHLRAASLRKDANGDAGAIGDHLFAGNKPRQAVPYWLRAQHTAFHAGDCRLASRWGSSALAELPAGSQEHFDASVILAQSLRELAAHDEAARVLKPLVERDSCPSRLRAEQLLGEVLQEKSDNEGLARWGRPTTPADSSHQRGPLDVSGKTGLSSRHTSRLTVASAEREPANVEEAHGAERPPRQREAERRPVTLVSIECDLVTDGDAEGLPDLEDHHEALVQFREASEHIAREAGGTVIQSSAQGSLICFGYPTGYEDAARRAVRAAMGTQRVQEALNKKLTRVKARLVSSARVHTGLVLVGDTGGVGENMSLIGEPRNVISRLGRYAPESGVILTNATHKLVRGYFVVEELGSHAMRESPRPVTLYRATGESGASSRLEAGQPRGLTPLTGRQRELGMLMDCWEQSEDGRGQVVMLSGEAGIGKSRLVLAAREHVNQTTEHAAIVEWRCSPQLQNTGLYPAADHLTRALGIDLEADPTENLDKLAAHLGDCNLAQPQNVALMARLLSIPPDERCPSLNLSPQGEREKMLNLLVDWLCKQASERPLLFAIEDVHWADASTLEVLGLLLKQSPASRIMVLIASRPEFKSPWPQSSSQTLISLKRLTKRTVAEMVQAQLGVASLPPGFIQQILERTDGVPLFVEEFVRIVRESDALLAGQSGLELNSSFPLHGIPDTLHDLLMDRLDRMATDRTVVQVAAALGREFSFQLIQRSLDMNEAALAAELGKLVEVELLYQRGRPPDCNYIFKHALLQEAAYQTLRKQKRKAIHASIVETLKKEFPHIAESQPELLAHHCIEAGHVEEGVEFLRVAGMRSLGRSDVAEAVAHFSKALEALKQLDESTERDALELQLQPPLGTATLALEGYAAPGAGKIFERARELCVKLQSQQGLFKVIWGTFAWRVVRGELHLCLGLSGEMMALAESQSDKGIVMEAHYATSATNFYVGDVTKALAHADAGLKHYDDRRCRLHAAQTGQNSAVTLRCHRTLPLWLLGYHEQSLAAATEAVEVAQQLEHPFSLAYAMWHVGRLYECCHMPSEALEWGKKTVELGTEQKFAFWQAIGELTLAKATLLMGQPQQAIEMQDVALRVYRDAGARLSLPYFYILYVEAWMQLGELEKSRAALDDALALAESLGEHCCDAELYRLKGKWSLANGDDASAKEAFEASMNIAQRQRALTWELRTATTVAHHWHTKGRTTEARSLLAGVYDRFEEGHRFPDLVDAKSLLDTMEE